MRTGWLAIVALFALGLASAADIVFLDDFENEALVESGNPLGWEIFGAPLLDRGTMHNSQYHSPTASVWVAVSWQSWGWGALTVSNESTRYDVLDDSSSVSSWMRATNALTAGSVAFTIFDADGTQWRTADADLFQLTTDWAQYASPVGDMVMEAAGSVAGLDYENVVKFGFLAYTAGQSGENTVQFDDFAVDTIPEPRTLVAALAGIVLLVLRRRAGGRAHGTL